MLNLYGEQYPPTVLIARNNTIIRGDPDNILLRASGEHIITMATFSNNIISNLVGRSNCTKVYGDLANPPIMNSLGYNLTNSSDCNQNDATDIILPSRTLLSTLGQLQDNGGATLTHALLANSTALDNGDCGGGTITVDQRGVSRPQGDGCDIGAFESETGGFLVLLPVIFR